MNEFRHPRIAAVYDELDPGRSDLDHYEQIVAELAATSVVDLGCGTGELACRLAARGIDVLGVDPAAPMLDVARSRPGADRVRWIHGDASALPPMRFDLATMTANVAQVIDPDDAWAETLAALSSSVRRSGHLVFETRDPERRAWLGWTPERTRVRKATSQGAVVAWCEVASVVGPVVTIRWTHVFESDGDVVTSDLALRFRTRTELHKTLDEAGFSIVDVRDAPDRPGKELVVIARRR